MILNVSDFFSQMIQLSLRVSEALDMDFKPRVSEVFTSGDVSLHNIVMFLSCYDQ